MKTRASWSQGRSEGGAVGESGRPVEVKGKNIKIVGRSEALSHPAQDLGKEGGTLTIRSSERRARKGTTFGVWDLQESLDLSSLAQGQRATLNQ